MSNASRKAVDECTRCSASMAAYVDGELDPGHAVDMEAHVIDCDTCAERVALVRAMRLSMKRAASAQRCPAALRARIAATIEEERRRVVIAHGPASESQAHAPKLMRLRYAVGLAAAAAGVMFAVQASRYTQAARGVTEAGVGSMQVDGIGIDALLEQLVTLHAHPFRPDTTDLDQLESFDPLLGVRVRRPAFQPLGTRFEGARLHPVSDGGAYLQLQYAMPGATTADGRHLTMYVFNPRVVPVRAKRLEQRMFRERQVLMGRVRGYAVGSLEQSGVGYAYASDLDPEESARMVLSALQQ